ncbi:MAG: PQQ-like beta-propeller repeat protein [Pirellulales bacterium]|nr:PQQ-like beta-propeller repeat protein [Pirellulales bacterium]
MHVRRIWFPWMAVWACAAACGPARTMVSGPPADHAPKRSANVPAAASESLPRDLSTRQRGHDWPAFLGPSGDSKSTETGISPWPDSGPPIVWTRTMGESYAMPAISRGRLVLCERIDDEVHVVALHSESGRELWEFRYPTDYQDLYGYDNGPRCQPVIDGNRVYVYGVEGMLYCLRLEDGAEQWKVDTTERFGVVQNFFGVGSTPLVEGDLLLVQVGGSPPESRRVPPGQLDLVVPNGSGLVAFNKFTGEVVYAVGDELASYASPVVADIGGRRTCLLFARGGLLGVDVVTGDVEFHFPWRARILESVNASNPVVVDNLVFISECYGPGSALLRVARGTCTPVWTDAGRRAKAMQTHWNTPIHVDGYLYGCSGRHTREAELRCIEFNTGKVTWSEPGLTRLSLLYVDGHLVGLTEYGELLLLRANPEKFDLVSRVWLRNEEGRPILRYPCWAAPALARGLLYLRGDRLLACVELIPQ